MTVIKLRNQISWFKNVLVLKITKNYKKYQTMSNLFQRRNNILARSVLRKERNDKFRIFCSKYLILSNAILNASNNQWSRIFFSKTGIFLREKVLTRNLLVYSIAQCFSTCKRYKHIVKILVLHNRLNHFL